MLLFITKLKSIIRLNSLTGLCFLNIARPLTGYIMSGESSKGKIETNGMEQLWQYQSISTGFSDNLKLREPKETPSSSDDEEGPSVRRDSGSSDEDGDTKASSKKDEKEPGPTTSVTSKNYLDYIQSLIAEKLRFHSDDESDEAEASGTGILTTVDFKGVMEKWKSGGFKNIITMVGAGISTCKLLK